MNKHESPSETGPAAGALPAAALALGLLLSACGTAPAPTHFHTLLPPPTAAAGGSAAAAVDWQLAPVQVAAQFNQPQWVLRVADGSLVMLENERWIAPLADELQAALVDGLTKAVGPPTAAAASNAPQWRIGVDVRRFELVADREARLQADWWLRRDDTSFGCHSSIVQQPDGPGYPALAAAQQRAVVQLADAIGRALQALNKGQAASC